MALYAMPRSIDAVAETSSNPTPFTMRPRMASRMIMHSSAIAEKDVASAIRRPAFVDVGAVWILYTHPVVYIGAAEGIAVVSMMCRIC